MKKLFYLLIGASFIIQSSAQNPGDTIVVQTFIHDAWTDGTGNSTGSGARDTVAYFPNDTSLTFEKIIMSYNMRCKDNNSNNPGGNSRIGCGAWDYSCQTYIHDSTRIDSILSKQASHTISSFSGNIYNYSLSPVYNYYQFQQQTALINSIISEDTIHIGNGADSLDFVIATERNSHKSQFLYKANELVALGLLNDTINALSLNVLSGSQTANFLTIKLKLTTDSMLGNINPHINGFTEVYNANTLLNSGVNRFQFINDFVWDSVSNIIVEFSITNSTNGSATLIEGEQANNNLGLFSNDANHITVNSAESIDLPTSAMSSISNEVTVSFWINGNANVLPQNTTIIEGYDVNNNRTLNIHFPWSNGRMYWDCGNSGTSSYDRIDKAASLSEYTDGWSHWAFTKNATPGDLKIYRNGVLWHSGTGHTRTIDIATLKLASQGNANGYFWDGHIKEVRIFDKELAVATINDWMIKRIDNSHPDYTNLVAHYPLNEGQGTTSLDNTINQQIATFSGNVNWNYTRGNKIGQFFTEVNSRPNINFYQGQYSLTITTDTILDSLIASANTITQYAIVPNYGTLQNDSIATVSTNTYWEAISYLFDANGNVLSVDTTNIDGLISITDLTYYKRYPMAFQIMSFVTPYGMGLDFGATGKTWYFDVTDYSPVLKGNKQITMSGGGQWQEDMDIKFLFIVGTPTRDVLEMQQIWRPQSKGYTTIMSDDAFEARSHTLLSNATSFKLRTSITGHGQEGEFIPRTHTLNLDGSNPSTYSWQVWTECADNPIYPQGGTWIYDRAGWCPGKETDLREDDITPFVTPGQSHIFDYGIDGASGSSNYWVNCQLVSYDDPNFSIDASIAEILSPTTSIKHYRRNPMCSKPEVVLQNTGSSTLTSVGIKYWINGGQQHTYNWSGNLDFLEKVEIELPDPTSLWLTINTASSNKFYVEIFEVNSSTDQYLHNNLMTSTFEASVSYPNTFALWFETNSGVVNVATQESENSWKFLNSDDNILFSSNILYANTNYRDTLTFDDGCYTFIINDEDEDGFDFWANNDGSGMARFRELGAGWLHAFDGDFGKFIFYEFKVGSSSSSIEQENYNINIYPNPSKDDIIISGDLSAFSEFIIVDNLGKIVLAEQINKNAISQKINIKSLAKGIYFVEIDDGKIIRKIVKQ